MDRVVLVARLKPNSRERVQELVAEYPSPEGLTAAFDRHAIFLSETEVVFFFEGPDADRSVRAILNDQVSSSEIGHCIQLFVGLLLWEIVSYTEEQAAATTI